MRVCTGQPSNHNRSTETSVRGLDEQVLDILVDVHLQEVVAESRQQRLELGGRHHVDGPVRLLGVEVEHVEAAVGERQQFQPVQQLVLGTLTKQVPVRRETVHFSSDDFVDAYCIVFAQYSVFGALLLLAGRQEEHPNCKN